MSIVTPSSKFFDLGRVVEGVDHVFVGDAVFVCAGGDERRLHCDKLAWIAARRKLTCGPLAYLADWQGRSVHHRLPA
jgi:hypothetical protein